MDNRWGLVWTSTLQLNATHSTFPDIPIIILLSLFSSTSTVMIITITNITFIKLIFHHPADHLDPTLLSSCSTLFARESTSAPPISTFSSSAFCNTKVRVNSTGPKQLTPPTVWSWFAFPHRVSSLHLWLWTCLLIPPSTICEQKLFWWRGLGFPSRGYICTYHPSPHPHLWLL